MVFALLCDYSLLSKQRVAENVRTTFNALRRDFPALAASLTLPVEKSSGASL